MELIEPATQLALVIEAAPEEGLSARLIPELAQRPLGEIVKLPFVANHLASLLERHKRSMEVFRQRAELHGDVVFFDVSGLDMEGGNKFIPYLLFPQCRYAVGVSSSPIRSKISLGSNPWNVDAAEKNLASLAEEFGGGGHPRVAAISLAPGELERARQVAREIVARLQS